MINKISKIITILEKEGVYVAIIKTINYIFRRLFKIELLIKTPMDNLKYYLSKKLFTISHGKVMAGAFKIFLLTNKHTGVLQTFQVNYWEVTS